MLELVQKLKKQIILSVTGLIFSSSMCYAQAELLNFTPGARVVGHGGIGVVGLYDPSVLYWNPAALAMINESKIIFSTSEPFYLDYSAFSHFFPLYGTFGLSLARTSTNENAFESLNFGWGFQLSPVFSVGASLGALQLKNEGWTVGGVGLLYRPFAKARYSNKQNKNRNLTPYDSYFLNEKLTIGMAVQNIPLVLTDLDHEYLFGISYNLSSIGPKLITAYHVNRKESTVHVGLESVITSRIRVYAGTEDFKNDHMAFGFSFGWENVDLDLTYSVYSKRLVVSLLSRIGKPPRSIVADKLTFAKSEIRQHNFRNALKSVRVALAYDYTNNEARILYTSLTPKVRRENAVIDSLLRVAQALEKQQYYISATAHYLRVLKIDPNNRVAEQNIAMIRPKVNIHTAKWFQIAVKRFERGEIERAKDIFESILIVKNDHEGCKEYLDKINEIYKERAETHFYTGLGFYRQKNYDRAKEEFEEVLNIQPNHDEAKSFLQKVEDELVDREKEIAQLLADANRLQRSQQYVGASRAYRKILALGPNHELARQNLTTLDKNVENYVQQQMDTGKRAFERGQFETAIKSFNAVQSIQPNNRQSRDYLKKISDAQNDSAQVYYNLGMKYFKDEKWNEALADFETALNFFPGHEEAKKMRQKIIDEAGVKEVVERGMSEYLSGRYLNAMELFNEALEIDPNNQEAMVRREECQKKLREEVENYFNRGIQFYTAENYREAVNEWNKALEINPQHKGSLEYKNKAEQRLRVLNELQ